jgi:NhaA family Na+:H+ antiporter
LAGLYHDFFELHLTVTLGGAGLDKSLGHWINDGLMAIFFFLVGLEIKRELMEGELSSMRQAALPAIAAVGGMAAPAAVYLLINSGTPETLAGWAIPAATDIAFAMGVVSLLGTRVPESLKIFLLALAIIDDLGAIAIIAVFYTAEVSAFALVLAALAIAVLVALNRFGVTRIAAYVLVGLFLWACVLKSGVHATLAGVVTALAVPLTGGHGKSPLEQLEHGLHPWIAFAVLPLFVFANAGVSFNGLRADDLLGPLPLGIALGLLAGKQVGVFGFMLLAIHFGLARKPASISWRQLWGLACLTGIGFTMSLFIGSLAFDSAAAMDQVKVGVLAGSLAAGLLGFLILRTSRPASDPSASPR